MQPEVQPCPQKVKQRNHFLKRAHPINNWKRAPIRTAVLTTKDSKYSKRKANFSYLNAHKMNASGLQTVSLQAMITDVQLAIFVNVLGVTLFLLVVLYHYVAANNPKLKPE